MKMKLCKHRITYLNFCFLWGCECSGEDDLCGDNTEVKV
jgi:hypothetical protein